MALAVVTSGLTGLRDGAAITGIPYISPIASLLLLVVNIRGVSVQLTPTIIIHLTITLTGEAEVR